MSDETSAAADTGLRRDILTTLLPAFDGPVAPEWVLRLLGQGLGGVCLFGSNVVDAAQLRALTASLREAGPESVVAIDEEGGDVTRLYYDRGAPYPGNAVLGRIDDVDVTERVARTVGEALADAGVTLTFAPDADANSNADNPVIGVRSFGADPELVARHTAAWVRGVQSTGVGASAKHFPGHGDTNTDSHLALPVVDVPLATLRSRELVPFRAAVAAGTRTIMTSHILLPHLDRELPATLSPHILHGLLRGELGFEGVIVTDALDMQGASGGRGIPEAAVLALAAGCDLLCIGADVAESTVEAIVLAVEAAVASGRLDEARVAEAAAHVRALAATAPALRAEVQGDASPDGFEAAPVLSSADIARAFEVRDGTLAALEGAASVGTVIRIDTVANIAIGVAPWGPFAAETVSATPSWLSRATIVGLAEDGSLGDPAALAGPVLVIGKDLHRHPFAVSAIDALRAARSDVATIDLGWPSDDRAYADIATFGASRLVGESVIDLVADALAADQVVVA
ncbi:glycoside hydrolase family 3 protein [Agromyces protaetiae]|uniref:Glycoside hydrolase family 3 protein n=1 Tax=Agromyces protaetiae TaxID=2509455 RepID=A0A4P6FFQ2_9MICO|nr:glycoside hydrolase family 3 N-terminal domain-containing protein [Agromyces protaetiae]QAY73249.1 glycoside hydrolase family 3 protein [Agromyces protaetiae]